MSIILLLLLPFAIISAQQMKIIQNNTQEIHKNFDTLISEVSKQLPYIQHATKKSIYSFDGTGGRTGVSLTISYSYRLGSVILTNTLTYTPSQADYYLNYINGLNSFQNPGILSYQVIPINKILKNYLWHKEDKTAFVVPVLNEGKSYGFFLRIDFPKNIKNEHLVVEDIVSKIDWLVLYKLFAL